MIFIYKYFIYKRMYFINIFNRKWYFRLVQNGKLLGLMNFYTKEQIYQRLLICLVIKDIFGNGDDRDYHLFTIFESYIEYIQYVKNIPDKFRCCFEVILGNFPQKPHFDIDVKLKILPDNIDLIEYGEEIKDYLIKSIIEVLETYKIKIKLEEDILIYSSHNEEKRSFHILVNNWCHQNNLEAKNFYNEIINYMKEKYNKNYGTLIDPKVYSKIQQFRLIGNHKQGSNRVKIFNQNFIYFGKEYKHQYEKSLKEGKEILTIYRNSLVSFISGCNYLPTFIDENANNFYSNIEQGDIDEDDVNQAFELLANKLEVSVKNCPFRIYRINSRTIDLTKPSGTICFNCQRAHNQNPLLYVNNGFVYYNCRRPKIRNSNDKPEFVFLGLIKDNSDKKIILDENNFSKENNYSKENDFSKENNESEDIFYAFNADDFNSEDEDEKKEKKRVVEKKREEKKEERIIENKREEKIIEKREEKKEEKKKEEKREEMKEEMKEEKKKEEKEEKIIEKKEEKIIEKKEKIKSKLEKLNEIDDIETKKSYKKAENIDFDNEDNKKKYLKTKIRNKSAYLRYEMSKNIIDSLDENNNSNKIKLSKDEILRNEISRKALDKLFD